VELFDYEEKKEMNPKSWKTQHIAWKAAAIYQYLMLLITTVFVVIGKCDMVGFIGANGVSFGFVRSIDGILKLSKIKNGKKE
jgi:hypothetical protein